MMHSTSTNGTMSLMTSLCTFVLLISSSTAEIFDKTWWNNTILYQIYPRSFYDSNADGIGDLKGITLKLPYFVDTGINAIWLSPIYPSPMVDFGYDISNFTDIDPIFGTLNDFKALLANAHKLSLKVLLDFVPNHTSDKHIWFQKALQGDEKYKNYYMWAEGKNRDNKTPPNNWLSVFDGPAWTYVDSYKQWYLHQFERRQPDLNFSNPDVREEMQNVMNFWLNMGIDGFRVDSASFLFEDKELRDEPRSYAPGVLPQNYDYLNHIYTYDESSNYELLGNWKIFIDQYADQHNESQKLMVTEAYSDLLHTIKFYDYDLLPFNFEFIMNVSANSSAEQFKQEIDLWMNAMPSGKVANWVLGNHDRSRVASRFPGRLDQMTMLSMILPGIAVTYYGDEIGMVNKNDISWKDTQDPQGCNAGKANYANRSRDPFRTPFQWNAEKNAGFSTANSTWLPVNENYKELNLKQEMRSPESHYKIYKTLVDMHRKELALTKGSYTSFTTNNGTVLGVIRKYDTHFVLLLINFEDDISQKVDLSDQGLPEKMKLKVASLGSRSSLKQQVDIRDLHLPKKTAVVYTSLNIH